MRLRSFQVAQLSDVLCDPGEQGIKCRKIGKVAVTGEHMSTDSTIWGSYCTGTRGCCSGFLLSLVFKEGLVEDFT